MDWSIILAYLLTWGVDILCLGVVAVVVIAEWRTGDRKMIKIAGAVLIGVVVCAFIANRIGMSDRAISIVAIIVAVLGYEVYDYRKKYIQERDLRRAIQDELVQVKKEFEDYKIQQILKR